MQIRLAQVEEAEAVHALLKAAFASFRPDYSAASFDATILDVQRVRQRMAEGPVWLALDGQDLGTVAARRDDRGVYVRGMAVHPEGRRRGVGRALLQATEDWAREQGAPCLWLSTTPFLLQSIALYETFGFRPARGPADLFGTPLRSFEKPLS